MVADALSRPPAVTAVVLPATIWLLNWAQLAMAQTSCEDLAALRAKRPHHLVAVQVEGFPVWCDISTWVWRLVVPRTSGSSCLTPSMGWYTQGYVPLHAWSAIDLCGQGGLATDVKVWSRQYVACCRAKVTHVEHSGVEKIPIPGVRFSHVHVGLVDPLPASRDGSTYLLTMIDCSTRWPH